DDPDALHPNRAVGVPPGVPHRLVGRRRLPDASSARLRHPVLRAASGGFADLGATPLAVAPVAAPGGRRAAQPGVLLLVQLGPLRQPPRVGLRARAAASLAGGDPPAG